MSQNPSPQRSMTKPDVSFQDLTDVLRAIAFWSLFAVMTLIFFVILIAVGAWHRLLKPEGLSDAAHRVATLWARSVMACAPGWRWTYSGFENLPKSGKKPVVLVANHQSAADIGSIYLTQAQFRWLSKDAVFRLPMLGLAMRWAGYVSITRGDRGSHVEALQRSAEWLRRGTSMFYFPEGTRSEDGQLKEFKVGAFRLAIQEGVAVTPIVLCGTKDMMRKNSLIPRPAFLMLDVMPPVWAEEDENPEAFALRVQQLISKRLRTLESSRMRKADKEFKV